MDRAPLCAYCGQRKSTDFEHVVAQKRDWVQGGHLNSKAVRSNRVNSPTNTSGACHPCNASKSDRPLGMGWGMWWPWGWPRGVWWPFGGAPR